MKRLMLRIRSPPLRFRSERQVHICHAPSYMTTVSALVGRRGGKPTTNMSVSIEKLESLETTKIGRWKDRDIGRITAGACRELSLDTVHVPETGFFSHGHVQGVKSKGTRKALARKMTLV